MSRFDSCFKKYTFKSVIYSCMINQAVHYYNIKEVLDAVSSFSQIEVPER